MSTLLITGGAGYVGSTMARRFHGEGIRIAVIDDLSTGHGAALPAGIPFYRGDFADEGLLSAVLADHAVDGVLHCAAKSLVEESVRRPDLYLRENFEKPRGMIRFLAGRGVRRFLLSSTAAVYREPEVVPIREDAPLSPTNPYGRSKAALEAFLDGEEQAGRLVRVSLRYFNAAGASTDGAHGEDHAPETHLIPRLLAALRDGAPFRVFGTDYATADGSALRDYVHVEDLASAHRTAWDLLKSGRGGIFNLGTGQGATVLEVARCAERISGRKLAMEQAPRRDGDPERLVASFDRARTELGWTPRTSLETILSGAWRWHQERPQGYDDDHS